MILILVRFMQIGRARESWQIYHKALALACTSNLREPHQNKNHSLNGVAEFGIKFDLFHCRSVFFSDITQNS